jgi:hypothetical protein
MPGLRCAIITLLVLMFSGQVFASELRVAALSSEFFNPSLGQSIVLTVAVPRSGTLTVLILDRDGYAVRYLCHDREVRAGNLALSWDGYDALGRIVPDEAYSFKIDLTDKAHHLTYFPAAAPAAPAKGIPVTAYDPGTGIITYRLPVASRVHIQAGTAIITNGKPEGPVLRTVVDRQPRIAGAVIDQWNGLDQSGTITVPEQPHFVMAIAASALPENAVITVGNRSTTFLAYVLHRRGASLVASTTAHAHHMGLQTLDDVAPALQVTPRNATWSTTQHAWILPPTAPLQVHVELQGPNASRFATQTQNVLVFLDGKRIDTKIAHDPGLELRVPIENQGAHILAVNWVGTNGPVAVNALRLFTSPQVAAR